MTLGLLMTFRVATFCIRSSIQQVNLKYDYHIHAFRFCFSYISEATGRRWNGEKLNSDQSGKTTADACAMAYSKGCGSSRTPFWERNLFDTLTDKGKIHCNCFALYFVLVIITSDRKSKVIGYYYNNFHESTAVMFLVLYWITGQHRGMSRTTVYTTDRFLNINMA